jgi:SAM-dependent methyltransferase
VAGLKALDVGCGGGILTDSLARAGASATGIDLSTKALRIAQLHALDAQTDNVQYREISAEAMAEEQPGAFDVVTCMEMLEHVPDPASVVTGLRSPGQTRRLGIFLDLEPKPQVIFVGHSGRGICAGHVASWHPRIRQDDSTQRTGGLLPCSRFVGVT